MKRPKYIQIGELLFTFLALGIVILCFGVRLFNVYNMTPFGDENGTFYWISHSYKDILHGYGTWLTMHWYILGVKGLDGVGLNLNHLRMLSILFSAIGWFFCYLTIRYRTHSVLALAGIGLVVTVPTTLGSGSWPGYDALIRAYPLVFMLVCICTYLWGRWCSEKKLSSLLGFSLLAATACILSLPIGLFFLSTLPILLLVYYQDSANDGKFVGVLKKDAISILALLFVVGAYCYIAQMTYLKSMLAYHSEFVGVNYSNLGNAVRGLSHFYHTETISYGLLFAVSLGVIVFYRKWYVLAAILLCPVIFVLLIAVLGIYHEPAGFSRIFYRYFHLIVVGTIIFSIHLVAKKHWRMGVSIAAVIIVYSCYFAVSNLRDPVDRGLKRIYETYLEDETSERGIDPLFVVDYPKQHWINSLAPRNGLVVDGYNGISLYQLADNPEENRNRSIIVLTRLCEQGRSRQVGQYCSYEYHSRNTKSALDLLVSDVEFKIRTHNNNLGWYVSYPQRRQEFVTRYSRSIEN